MVLNQQDFKIIIDKLYKMKNNERTELKKQILSKKITDKLIEDLIKNGHSKEIITIIDNFDNIIKTESSSADSSSDESSRKYSPVSLNDNSSMVLPESTEENTSQANIKLLDLLKSDTETEYTEENTSQVNIKLLDLLKSDTETESNSNIIATSSVKPINDNNISATSSVKPDNLISSKDKNETSKQNNIVDQDTEELYQMLKNIANDF